MVGNGQMGGRMDQQLDGKKNNALESIFIELINSKKQNISLT